MSNAWLFVFFSIDIVSKVYCSTTTAATTTANPNICNVALNLSPNLSPYWILMVISSVPSETNASSCAWRNLMESRLLNLLIEANSQALIARRRRRRSVTSGTLQLQLISADRVDGSTSGKVRIIYYAMQSGSYLRASQAAANVNGIGDRAAIILGYPVDLPAMSYDASLVNSSYRLWTIGVVAGVLGGIVVIAWTVLIVYAKCLRPKDRDDVTVDVVAEEFYTDSMRPVAHLNANPKISYSNADIEVIADQVARRLDAHMSEMLQLHHTGGHSHRDLSTAWTQDPELNAVENGPPAVTVQSEGPKRRRLPRTPSEIDAMEMEPGGNDVLLRRIDSPAVGAQRRPPAKSNSPAPEAPASSALQSKSIDRGRKKHDEVERRRNKERLRSRQMSCEDRRRFRNHGMSSEEKLSPDEASASTVRLLKTPAESPLQQATALATVASSQQPQCLWPESGPQQLQQASRLYCRDNLPPALPHHSQRYLFQQQQHHQHHQQQQQPIILPRKPRGIAKEHQNQPQHLHAQQTSTAVTEQQQPKPPKRVESMPPGSAVGCSRTFQLPLTQLSHEQQHLQQHQAHIPAPPLGCKVQAVVLPYVSANECQPQTRHHLHHLRQHHNPDTPSIVYGQNIGQQSVTSDDEAGGDEDAASPTDTVIMKVKRHDRSPHV